MQDVLAALNDAEEAEDDELKQVGEDGDNENAEEVKEHIEEDYEIKTPGKSIPTLYWIR